MAAGATPRDTGMLYKAAAFVGAGVVAAGLGYAFLLYTRKSRNGAEDAVDDSPDMQDQVGSIKLTAFSIHPSTSCNYFSLHVVLKNSVSLRQTS